MPCSEPTMSTDDQRVYETCQLINAFAQHEKLLHRVPEWILKRRYIYPYGDKLDEVVEILCDFCKLVGEDFIYNARDRDCRHLADWWEDHQQQEGHEHV